MIRMDIENIKMIRMDIIAVQFFTAIAYISLCLLVDYLNERKYSKYHKIQRMSAEKCG